MLPVPDIAIQSEDWETSAPTPPPRKSRPSSRCSNYSDTSAIGRFNNLGSYEI